MKFKVFSFFGVNLLTTRPPTPLSIDSHGEERNVNQNKRSFDKGKMENKNKTLPEARNLIKRGNFLVRLAKENKTFLFSSFIIKWKQICK